MPMATDSKTSEIKDIKKENFFKIFFNHTCNAGVVYYRMIQFANYIQDMEGISLAYSKYDPKGTAQLTAKWEADMVGDKIDKYIQDFDMLMDVSQISVWQYIHSHMGLALFLTYRNKLKKPILVEIDDDIFNVNPENLGSYGYYPNSNAEFYCEQQLRNAHGVICSTQWLAKQMQKYNPCTWVMPNSIDFKIWDNLKKTQRHKNIRIGWSGSDSHDEDLKILKQIIPEVLKKHKDVEFVFYGGFPKGLESHKRLINIRKWADILSYPQVLKDQGFDIGLAPLKDNLFNRSKSNLRYLEYSALKIPTISSPVEPFDLIEQKVSGIKAQTPSEWIQAIDLLIKDVNLRRYIGLNAYNTIKREFNAEVTAKKYVTLLQNIHEGKEKVNMARYENGSVIL
jgi:glycosyltransferase involved in cell wall biosynthesis